ncbi:MAG: serine/threonine protein kinase [Lentisphaerae bacterium]|nr:serine/threonine protein kinase [Lentisphaerota bacterium]
MKEFNTTQIPERLQTPEEESTVSLLIDPDSGDELPSPDELRSIFKISDGDDYRDYGDLKIIGLGGMGAVFQADDPALQRKVALKILRTNFRNRRASIEKFVREARITAKIDHPNIVSVHRLGVLENIGVYFTMKHINGENLRTILNKLASGDAETVHHYTLRRLLEIFTSSCNAVAAAHDHGILHCDLKPGNIMIGNFGEVLVMDWGVAREKYDPENDGNTTAPQGVEGTPVFMAPELLCGQLLYPDEQTDVYGLGAILYTILTRGNLPFDVTCEQDTVIMQIVSGEIIPVKNNLPKGVRYHRELAAICAKAMAHDRNERYKNVEELKEDIDNYLDGFPVSACSPNFIGRFFKLIRRRPLIPAVLLAIGMSLAAYCGINRLQAIAAEDTLRSIIVDHIKQGNAHRRLAMMRFTRLQEKGLSIQERSAIQQNMFASAASAAVEYNQIFDAASRLSEEKREHFLYSGGTKIFAQLLRMHWRLGNVSLLRDTLSRCKLQWKELFTEACRIDLELQALVRRISRQLDSSSSAEHKLL